MTVSRPPEADGFVKTHWFDGENHLQEGRFHWMELDVESRVTVA
jgi:uncharacterized protein YodC (DUF2158 family)